MSAKAKIKNDPVLLASAVAGWRGIAEDAIFSSPCWMAYHAARYLKLAHAALPVKCAMSRGHSVKIETAQGNAYHVSFSGRRLEEIRTRTL